MRSELIADLLAKINPTIYPEFPQLHRQAKIGPVMPSKQISTGVVHSLPSDLRSVLLADPLVLDRWEDITPLARNEWICWVEDAKKTETRNKRIARVASDLKDGKRRPCCWPGCTHREKTGK